MNKLITLLMCAFVAWLGYGHATDCDWAELWIDAVIIGLILSEWIVNEFKEPKV